MNSRQSLPLLWLLSDQRNDAVLESALRARATPIAFVFRHYHLAPAERRRRFRTLARLCRARRHLVLLAGSPAEARRWGAEGCYGPPGRAASPRRGLLRIVAAHDLRELACANRVRPDAILLSPVFPTRSHPGAGTLGPLRFRLLARHALAPLIALGGMNPQAARRLGWTRWAAIDGLSPKCDRASPKSGRRRADS